MNKLNFFKIYTACVCIYIYLINIHSTHTYSALQKYWNGKYKMALLAVESRHLQIWFKDEYETKLQKKFITFRVSSPDLMWA